MMLLDLQNVSLTIDNQQILRDLDLQVPEGDIHSLLGVNGVGKSTLASLLMGLHGLRPDTGRIVFDGKDITKASITERAKSGLTLAWQSPAAFPGLSVKDYLELSARAASTNGDVHASLKLVGMDPDRYFHRMVNDHLSGGERRRVELAAVMVMAPRLAILDEPDSGIDFLSLGEITNVIRRLSIQGTAILLITHREEMALMANQSSLMCAGTVVATGEPHSVTAYYREHCDACKQPNVPDMMRIIDELQ